MPFRLAIAKIGTILFFVITLAGCYAPHYLYAPTAENIPSFTGKNQSDIDIAISGRGADAQVAYAVSDHIAISGSWYFRNEHQFAHIVTYDLFNTGKQIMHDTLYYHRRVADMGLTYYSNIAGSLHFYLFLTAGGGIGSFKMKSHGVNLSLPDSTLSDERGYYNAKMYRVFFQPAIMFADSMVKIVGSCRLSGFTYRNAYTSYDDDELSVYGYDYADTHLSWFVEPALTFKIYPRNWLSINVQTGFTLNISQAPFDYRFFIGNIGVGIDTIQLLQQHRK